ncbi:hypothetical protein PI95_026535 [Hassallia byssoidea VB512170]|uniref:Uncharacterized protein n=1 Tax=Hassallia byssoidea VB512170 TaxID=1304833 RepID=A0A846HH61_9CYAN|nr:hypothetical protein [Hassalia byssoidea]NEU76014.1 hypothetical protein [Hassalia byssoidea VB512170]
MVSPAPDGRGFRHDGGLANPKGEWAIGSSKRKIPHSQLSNARCFKPGNPFGSRSWG